MPAALLVYQVSERTIRQDEPLEHIRELLNLPECYLWLEITDPQESDIALLREQLSIHPLTLEDIQQTRQRPKLEIYEHYSYWVAYECAYAEEIHQIRVAEINLIVGKNYLVTVHAKPAHCLESARAAWLKPKIGLPDDPGFLAYLIVDSVVDGYFPVLESLRNDLENIEERIFANVDRDFLQSLFSIKKTLQSFRRLAYPLRDIFAGMLKREGRTPEPSHTMYLRDVYDHLIRISDSIDILREQMTGTVDLTIDLYLANLTNRTNGVMRNLTVISTCMMSMTLISSIYGMNFKHMPELEWQYGYPFALVMMTASAGLALWIFKLRKYI